MIELRCDKLIAKKISGEEPMDKKLVKDRIELLDKSLFLGPIEEVADRIRSLTYNTKYIDKKYENFRIECHEEYAEDYSICYYYFVADRIETDKEYNYRLKIEEKKQIKEQQKQEQNKVKKEEKEYKEYERLKKKFDKECKV